MHGFVEFNEFRQNTWIWQMADTFRVYFSKLKHTVNIIRENQNEDLFLLAVKIEEECN